ncbi:hypothetical protein [Vibrio maerlii]|uniref:hypothetical protein n=1 Tax=Vibrio maerlii TaxID=2231648 RepID=UPI000E3EC630|nr:hypothetical protein [Vibrio maerlii]
MKLNDFEILKIREEAFKSLRAYGYSHDQSQEISALLLSVLNRCMLENSELIDQEESGEINTSGSCEKDSEDLIKRAYSLISNM